MILDVKRLALERGISASDVVQKAVSAWLARRKARRRRGTE
jgi:Arc/MetJ-type ribon-helix-helix transcriptional regulator